MPHCVLAPKEVMNFLGKKLRGNFEGEIVSDLTDFSGRIPGCRIKHRVKENWLKMYDKAGLLLRVGDLRQRLASTPHLRQCANDPKKASAKISRLLRRFRTHGLIAKIPRTRRWRITVYGRRVMGTALYLRNHDFSRAYSQVAA